MGQGLFKRLEAELAEKEESAGVSMLDVLSLPEHVRGVVNWMMRQHEVGLGEIVAYAGEDEAAGRSILALLVEKGLVQQVKIGDETRYRVLLAGKRVRGAASSVWDTFDKKQGD